MSTFFKIKGVLVRKGNEEIIREDLRKRTFVIEESGMSPVTGETIKFSYVFDLINNHTADVEQFKLNDFIEVFFNIKCKEYKKEDEDSRFFVSLQAWKILPVKNTSSNPEMEQFVASQENIKGVDKEENNESKNIDDEDLDDLPF